METAEAQGLLQREVAELLGVSRPRVAQLVAAGHLRRNAAGKIDPAEVERCKRKEPIAWPCAVSCIACRIWRPAG